MEPLFLLSLSTLLATSSSVLTRDELLSLDGEVCEEDIQEGRYIHTPQGIPVVFDRRSYHDIYMNVNGLLSFGGKQGGGFRLSFNIPNGNTSYLAPLFTFGDLGIYCSWNTTDSNIISDLEEFLEVEGHYTRFNPRLVIVTSWKNVTHPFEDIVLTFQAILATDGKITYSKFLYHSYMFDKYDYFVGFYSGSDGQNLTLVKSDVRFTPEQLNDATKPYRIDGNCVTPSTHSCNNTSYAQSCDPLVCNQFPTIESNATEATHGPLSMQSTENSTGSVSEKLPVTEAIEDHLLASKTTRVTSGHFSRSAIIITAAIVGATAVFLLLFIVIAFAICCLINKKKITTKKQKRAVGYYFGMKFDSDTNIDHVLSPTYRFFKRNSEASIVTTIEDFKPEFSRRRSSSSIEFRFTRRTSDTVLVPVLESAEENPNLQSTDKLDMRSPCCDIPRAVGTVNNSHQQNTVMQDSGIELCNDDGTGLSYILPNNANSVDSSNYYASWKDKNDPTLTFSMDMEKSSSPYLQTDSFIKDSALSSRDRNECDFDIFELPVSDDAVF